MVSKLADVAKKAVWPALIYNLCNEPAFKFNLCVFGDKSSDVQSRTSFFTQRQVIYLETESDRYEICRQQSSTSSQHPDEQGQPSRFTFSRVLNPHQLDNEFFSRANVPLDPEYKEVIADNLDWHDLVWSDF